MVPAAPEVPRLPRRSAATPQRWLLFVHQLPTRPSNIRVRTWRRLQQLGALVIKQAVYVLPDSGTAREDFEWLKTEIESAGGEASVFAADTVDKWSNDALVDEFRRTREEAYNALALEAERVVRSGTARAKRSPAPTRRAVRRLRERFAAIERVDFFGSGGRDRVVALLEAIEGQSGATRRAVTRGRLDGTFTGRLWVTRPRPGVDRMASAWLVQRFIDATARFDFVPDREAVPVDAVPFDMFGVEFTHRDDHCTFEMLCATFELQDAALARIAEVVHDLDLKDGRFKAADAPTIGLVIDGLQRATSDDGQLLSNGIALVEALYRAYGEIARPARPRVVSGRRSVAKPSRRRAR